MEFHALSQCDGPGLGVGAFPGCRKLRHDRQIWSDPHEVIDHRLNSGPAAGVLQLMRVYRGWCSCCDRQCAATLRFLSKGGPAEQPRRQSARAAERDMDEGNPLPSGKKKYYN